MFKNGFEPLTQGFSVQCSTPELLKLFILDYLKLERDLNPQLKICNLTHYQLCNLTELNYI